MNPKQIYKIARREYIARVRNKAFVLGTLLVPVFVVLYAFVVPLLFTSTGQEELKLTILDDGTRLGDKLAERLATFRKPRVNVIQTVVAETSEESRRPFNESVRNQELDGYLVLRRDDEIGARGRYYARETGNVVVMQRLENAIEATVLEELLTGTGVDVDQVRRLQRSDLETITISDAGEQESGFQRAFFSTLILGMLLYMAVLINGQGMALAIVEEKASRLIEVILGAVTATEFMIGKILGVLGSGLTQLAVWLGFALAALLVTLPAFSLGASVTGFDLSSVLTPTLLFYFAIFFALGYFLYSTLFAMVAATCTSTEELGQALFPAMLPMILAFMATFYVVGNPSTTATRILSLIPFFTPLVMLARVNLVMPPLWEIWLGIVLLLVGAFAVAWTASKVFRFALLLHGKRLSIPEVVRLIRAG